MEQNIEKNFLKEIRESLLMSKSELSRKAKISPLTISRIEQGMPCRMDTKRKILLALGLKLTDKDKVFHQVKQLYQIVKETQEIKMSEKYPECPLYNHKNCKEIDNRKVCAIVRKDKICLRKLPKSVREVKK